MHAYTPDGRSLLVLDAYGLTRLTFPNKIRTEGKIMGSERAALASDRDGTRVMAWNDGWNQTFVLGIADFKPVIKSARFNLENAVYAPDGSHVLRVNHRALEVRALTGGVVHSVPIPAVGATVIELGEGALQPSEYESFLRVAHDGTFALQTSFDGGAQLHLGSIDSKGVPRFVGSWALDLRAGGVLWLFPDRGETDVLWHDLARSRAHGARVNERGVVGRFELPAYGTPAPRGEHWVTQTAADTVIECDREGSVLCSWTLPEAMWGVGEVMPNARALFMPADRERLYDLDSGEIIARKLKADELPVRAFFTSMLARYNLAARRFGRALYLSEVRYWSHRVSASGHLRCNRGDGSLGGAMIAAMLFARMARGERKLGAFQTGGASASGYGTSIEQAFDGSDVEALFAACDEGGLWLGDARDAVCDLFGARFGSSMTAAQISARDASAPQAFELMLRGMLHHYMHPSAPRLMPEVPGWKALSLDVPTLRAALMAIDAKAPPIQYGNLDALVVLIARVLPIEDAGATFLWLSLDIDPLFTCNCVDVIARAFGRMKAQRPDLARQWHEFAEAHEPVMLHGTDKRVALLAALSA